MNMPVSSYPLMLFFNEGRQTQWAETMWRAACKEYGEDYECSVPMIRLVRLFGIIIT